jgi:GAF domain-containing protein
MPAAQFPNSEVERLAALHAYEILDTACEDAFDNIVHLAADLTGSPISVISLIDADRQWFKARVGLDETETPRAQSFCAHAILNPHEALAVADATLDPRFADNPAVQAVGGIRFYAGVPLLNPEGLALGTLCVADPIQREMSEAHRNIMRRLAETVVTTLELRRAMNRVRDLALADPLTESATGLRSSTRSNGRLRARKDTVIASLFSISTLTASKVSTTDWDTLPATACCGKSRLR